MQIIYIYYVYKLILNYVIIKCRQKDYNIITYSQDYLDSAIDLSETEGPASSVGCLCNSAERCYMML